MANLIDHPCVQHKLAVIRDVFGKYVPASVAAQIVADQVQVLDTVLVDFRGQRSQLEHAADVYVGNLCLGA